MTAKRTNVVFILSDDQATWGVGCYGNPEIRTPHTDRLAAEGVRFDNFFCATPVCSPSRATFLTGRLPSQHGVHDHIRAGNVNPGIEYLANEICYTDVLAEHGWVCGISGKWHLGASQLAQHGFSHWYVHQGGGGPYYDAPMVRDGALVREPGYVTDRITDDAIAFVRRHGGGPAPFYLSVHYTAPHRPWDCHPEQVVSSYSDCAFESCPQEARHPWATSMTDEYLGVRWPLLGYFASVTAMDDNIGRLLTVLDDMGIRQNTLVIFASDNGFSCGQHGFWGKGNGTAPRNMYESSIKVPFIVSHPGSIAGGRVHQGMASAYDVLPTLLEYVGLPMPERRGLVGQSFLPALLGAPMQEREPVFVFDEYGETRMIRTSEWKYVHRYPDGPHELWDLRNDPDERRNLVADAAQTVRVRDMRGALEDWFARHSDPALDATRQGVTGRGQMRPVLPGWEGRGPAYHPDTPRS